MGCTDLVDVSKVDRAPLGANNIMGKIIHKKFKIGTLV